MGQTGTSTAISADVTLLDEATSAGASDTLLIEKSGVNKKITPGDLITPKAVTGTAPVVSSDPTGTSTAISMDVTLLDEATSADASDTLLIEQSGVNKKITLGNLITPKAVTGTAPVVSNYPTGTSTAISMDVTLLDEATSAGASDTVLIEQSGVNKKITLGNLITPKVVTGTAPVVSPGCQTTRRGRPRQSPWISRC